MLPRSPLVSALPSPGLHKRDAAGNQWPQQPPNAASNWLQWSRLCQQGPGGTETSSEMVVTPASGMNG